jgi:hypothetical protein
MYLLVLYMGDHIIGPRPYPATNNVRPRVAATVDTPNVAAMLSVPAEYIEEPI